MHLILAHLFAVPKRNLCVVARVHFWSPGEPAFQARPSSDHEGLEGRREGRLVRGLSTNEGADTVVAIYPFISGH